jgi:hypothetical protein
LQRCALRSDEGWELRLWVIVTLVGLALLVQTLRLALLVRRRQRCPRGVGLYLATVVTSTVGFVLADGLLVVAILAIAPRDGPL